jgi:excisionase family DNA binding protein
MGRIKISDAAALLSVSHDTVRRWVEQGRLSDLRDEAGAHVDKATNVTIEART